VRCASAGAERPKCGLRAGPAYVVIPRPNFYWLPAGNQLERTAPLLNRGRPSVLWGVSWFPTWPSCRGTHRAGGCHQCVVRARERSAGRCEGGPCAGPAYVVTPQGKKITTTNIKIKYVVIPLGKGKK
jgi:hypothetical protein